MLQSIAVNSLIKSMKKLGITVIKIVRMRKSRRAIFLGKNVLRNSFFMAFTIEYYDSIVNTRRIPGVLRKVSINVADGSESISMTVTARERSLTRDKDMFAIFT
jgi:hypothetical protein